MTINETQIDAMPSLDWLDTLISQAPADNVPQPTQNELERSHSIGTKDGWGEKYCGKTELHGDEWFAAFESAKPVIQTGGIVAMIGDRGPGKTQMAAELAKTGDWPQDKVEYRQVDGRRVTGRTALYRRAIDLFLDLRHAAKNHVQSSEKEVLAKLADVGFLVLDEFQERGESEWENRIVNNLIDKRYAAGRPTIIIANLSRKELFATLGNSIVDRARENGKSIEFNWPSYRSQ